MRDHLRHSRLETILNVVRGKGRSRLAQAWKGEMSLRFRLFKPAAVHLVTPPSPPLLYPLTRAPRFYEEYKKEIKDFSIRSAYERSDWCINGWAIR